MISEWRSMWMLVMFDLPTDTKIDKRNYRQFRNLLLDEGFSMLQFSVYGRHCATRERVESKEKRIEIRVPPRGEVRILTVTDAQFARMRIYQKTRRKAAERPAEQLEFW